MFFIMTISCSAPQKKQENINKNTDIDWLIGKSINNMDSILDIKKEGNFFVYIFNYHDCGSCINAGFHISKKIDALYGQQIVYPISSMINTPSEYQRANGYYKYIYIDDKDLIRRELKYAPTPMLLFMSDNNVILNVFFPIDTIAEHYNNFVKSCLENYNRTLLTD